MPITSAVDESGTFLVSCLSGRVTGAELVESTAETTRMVCPDRPFATLLILVAGTDFSELTGPVLSAVRRERRTQLARLGLRRRAGAVVAESLDLTMIMRLWNALSDADPASALPFELFETVPPALAWLGIAPEIGLPVVERAGAVPG